MALEYRDENVIRIYFFEDDQGRTSAVSSDRYKLMLQHFFSSNMEELSGKNGVSIR